MYRGFDVLVAFSRQITNELPLLSIISCAVSTDASAALRASVLILSPLDRTNRLIRVAFKLHFAPLAVDMPADSATAYRSSTEAARTRSFTQFCFEAQ